mmetsp:Transcript_4152/g.15982  ORF Transcript_4152/g.15982 Transcript_4152/m.15982 type:complete len:200 (-) Transcript_4152:2141-2740(-)
MSIHTERSRSNLARRVFRRALNLAIPTALLLQLELPSGLFFDSFFLALDLRLSRFLHADFLRTIALVFFAFAIEFCLNLGDFVLPSHERVSVIRMALVLAKAFRQLKHRLGRILHRDIFLDFVVLGFFCVFFDLDIALWVCAHLGRLSRRFRGAFLLGDSFTLSFSLFFLSLFNDTSVCDSFKSGLVAFASENVRLLHA